ncbi:MAG: ACT domain-containing protein [Hydrogenophaga sp.]|uniref:ACT domain-containing protein n=1 Tax=Hydrogenophaga sp. TaxID=1904254 RepID=UPI001DB9DDE4|nr:ACT domain-containing protein [Hydrogenophaga sp.]MBX3610495.1 ACT domain-containing protein [Hydrogenophaga sp.]
MPAETHLPTLLRQMQPSVHPEVFVFCCFADGVLAPGLSPVGSFVEAEGLTAIVPQAQAQALNLPHQFASRLVTLTIHSALDAVGFMARISAALAAQGIACNVVSAFHHDHVFVPAGRLDDALRALAELSASA